MDQVIKTILKDTFFVVIDDQQKEDIAIKEDDLKKEAIMKELIIERTSILKGRDERLAGANMMKWVANLCTAHQYTISLHNQWLEYEEYAFYSEGKEGNFTLKNAKLVPLPEKNREGYVIKQYQQLFERFRPMIEMIALTSNLPVQQVWGLLCNPFYNQQEAWMATSTDDERVQINSDLKTLRELDSATFGLKRNPYKVSFRYVDSWWEPVEPLRVKAACCMSYVGQSGKKCFLCPKLTKDERTVRGQEIKEEKAK
ncbi:hypothetical protein [Bacillus sp. FJAT-45037]|uniref:hypothetical protein n=1 Tax=Bacillus sp. FJAT-45037 TaxID=2011007 RepID=UPI000C23241E|nr:hypothetical protein [Bacillus sp. FJAT-45037]